MKSHQGGCQETCGNIKGAARIADKYWSFLHVTTISRIVHVFGLQGRVARRKPFLMKKETSTQNKILPKQTCNYPKPCDKMYCDLRRPRWIFLGITLKDMFAAKTRHHTHCEACLWQHRAMELLLFSWDWSSVRQLKSFYLLA